MEKSSHKNYYEIEADTGEELFMKLGKTFGGYARRVVEKGKNDPDWERRLERAASLLKFTEQYFPEYVRELRAYAAAAHIDFMHLWALSLEDDAEIPALQGEHCTSIVTNNGDLCGHFEDWYLDSAHKVALLKTTVRDRVAFQIYYINTLGGSSVTVSNGRIQMVQSVRHPKKQDGVPKNVIARFLADSPSLEDALEKLSKIPQISAYSYVFVLPDSTVMNVEGAPDKYAVKKVETPFVHTNHYLDPELQKFEGAHEGIPNSHLRFNQANALVSPEMGVEQFKRLMSDRSRGEASSLYNDRTVARVILDKRKKVAEVILERNSGAWVSHDLAGILV